jgi:hypothetical protein
MKIWVYSILCCLFITNDVLIQTRRIQIFDSQLDFVQSESHVWNYKVNLTKLYNDLAIVCQQFKRFVSFKEDRRYLHNCRLSDWRHT